MVCTTSSVKSPPTSNAVNQRGSTLLRIARALDPIAIWSGQATAWLIIPMVLALSYEVVSRYVFNAPTLWAYDVTFMLYGSFFMLGAAYTLQRKGHIRTDSLYAKWSVRRQGWTDVVCYVIMFLPFVAIFLWAGWPYFVKAYLTNERFVSSPWMAVTWPFKMVLPLTGLLLLLQGVSELCKSLYAATTGVWPESEIALADKATT
jgi:TRAP-type mannitol/chloroaromatic compound transport system permease small subunit